MEMYEQIQDDQSQEVAVVVRNCTSGLDNVGKAGLKLEMVAMHNLARLDIGMADLADLEMALAFAEGVVIACMGYAVAALVFW
jgi:hypothetical protein